MTKTAKTVKRIFSAAWWILVILLFVLLITVLGAKMRGEVPKIFGYSVMRIVTGSMEDTIETGTYILVKDTDPEDIDIGNIISFYSEEEVIYGLPNTHRVQDIIRTDEGLEFVTKGDANPSNDAVNAKEDRVIGVYVRSLDFLGDFADFLNGGGIPAIMTGLLVATAGMMAYAVFIKAKRNDEDSEADKNKDE